MTHRSTQKIRMRSLLLGGLVTALLVVPAVASADVDTAVRGGIKTTDSQSASPSSGTQMTTASFVYKIRSCSTPYIPVASAPSGYVVGNCLNGVHLYPQTTSTVDGILYYGGWIYGNYNGCGWTGGSLSATTTDASALCPSTSIGYNLSEFAVASNYNAKFASGNDCNKSATAPNNCTDGSTTATIKACTVWANYRPWASGQGPTDAITNAVMPAAQLASGSTVKWRYVAKYATSGGISYVMIKLANSYGIQAGYGNWGFINRNCLPSTLPYYTAV
jgi:hypothetical protein